MSYYRQGKFLKLYTKFFLFTFLGLVFLFSGCVTTPPNLNDPSQTLRITIESIPSGAKVFTVGANNTPGQYIGTTPFTFRYAEEYGTVYGDYVKETLTIRSKDPWPWELSEGYLAFKCIVYMEGHAPYLIKEVIEKQRRAWGGSGAIHALGGNVHKTFTAIFH